MNNPDTHTTLGGARRRTTKNKTKTNYHNTEQKKDEEHGPHQKPRVNSDAGDW